MKKYRVRRAKYILSKMPNGKYEILIDKSRFYEGTVISFIRGM